MGHALDLGHAVLAHVHCAVGLAFLAAKIAAAGEFAHHHEIDAAQHFGLDRRVRQRGGVRLHRPQVGEHAERLAQGEQALLRPHRGLGIAPARPSHCAQQHGIGALAGGERGLR
jgi:hypothetical protein